jgi:aminoglycoside phosphotransferase (APT) family kinase protein
MAMHKDQLDVSGDVARSLVDDQFPQWRALPLRPLVGAATVNTIFRLGDQLTARFPLVGRDAERIMATLRTEARASAEFAAVSPVPTPEPVALGEPGHGYPLPWSVQTWVPGHDATREDPADSRRFADDLAVLLIALRDVDTRGRRFAGTGRGGHLPDHDEWMEVCFCRSEGLLDVRRLRSIWTILRALPEVDDDVMAHGDLTPPNLLVQQGRLAGVLDSGGFAAADPALDLVSVWHVLNESVRNRVRDRLGCGEVQWMRGMAWAFQQAMGLVWYYAETNPVMSRFGGRTLVRLLAAPEMNDLDNR